MSTDPCCTGGLPAVADAADETPLRLAQPEQLVRITRVADGDEHAARLKQLGLCVGRQVQLVKPGDPLIVRLYGSRVAISARLAEVIHVRPLACCRSAAPTQEAGR